MVFAVTIKISMISIRGDDDGIRLVNSRRLYSRRRFSHNIKASHDYALIFDIIIYVLRNSGMIYCLRVSQ